MSGPTLPALRKYRSASLYLGAEGPDKSMRKDAARLSAARTSPVPDGSNSRGASMPVRGARPLTDCVRKPIICPNFLFTLTAPSQLFPGRERFNRPNETYFMKISQYQMSDNDSVIKEF